MATINNNNMSIGTIIFKHGTKAQLNSSSYVPAEGEVITCTDAAILKVGDGTTPLAELPTVGSIDIEDNYTSTSANSGLSAAKGKDLNDRLSAWENVVTIDCGELPVEETEEQSGE